MCRDSKCCGKCGMCTPNFIVKILLIVGGVNWGLVGVGMLVNADWNVVHMIFGSMSTIEAAVYILVGVAAVMKIFGCRCAKCQNGVCHSCEEGDKEGEAKM